MVRRGYCLMNHVVKRNGFLTGYLTYEVCVSVIGSELSPVMISLEINVFGAVGVHGLAEVDEISLLALEERGHFVQRGTLIR